MLDPKGPDLSNEDKGFFWQKVLWDLTDKS